MEVEIELRKTDGKKMFFRTVTLKWMDLIQVTHRMCRTNSMKVMISLVVKTE